MAGRAEPDACMAPRDRLALAQLDGGRARSFRQPIDQLPIAREPFGLTEREAAWVGQLLRGRALWRMQNRGLVAQTVLTRAEMSDFDKDQAMS